MYHYKLSPKDVWEMTEEQVEMLIHGLAWMGIVKIKPMVESTNAGAWGHLGRLIGK